ncbi:hypothetical protein KIPB_006636 [Kipferlia bialata]|uniref:Uncharacterized protein n=1 Tax=Kipferlia bialata TaxID=797122 RepID=A0A391NWQ4_9EUKA|nr:hypothetical protein KIPB_006636 [Kipferlia bialata]|eukprot:g6636.t1
MVPIFSWGKGEWLLGCISEGVAEHSEACDVMSAMPLRIQRYPILSPPVPNPAITGDVGYFEFADNDNPALAFLSPTEV